MFLILKKNKEIYAYRTVIANSTSQQVSEFLMDTRYAYMSSFSIYTNIHKLLIEKLAPPYDCSLSVWIVEKLLIKLPILFSEIMSGSVNMKVPKYSDGQRLNDSLGGKIILSSLWGSYKLLEPQEILDEAFLYVFTVKEPSNNFHEEINAIKTILDFQKQYDDLDSKYKNGDVSTKENFYEFFENTKYVGYSASVIKKINTIYTFNKQTRYI